MQTIKVFAPATVANLGCGFDVMGMAIEGAGDMMEVAIEEGDGIEIANRSGVRLPTDVEANVVTPAVRALLAAAGLTRRVRITVLKKIKPGSGIGSSAASSAAAVFGLNLLLGKPFDERQLVEFAMEGESLIGGGARHADNVAPAIMGGVVLVRDYHPLDIVRLPVPRNFFAAITHPHITVTTRGGRAVLAPTITMAKAVTQWGNVGGLVAGFAFGDMALIGRSMRDEVAEPVRKRFIPGYDELRAGLYTVGALAVNIAGSGPSIFALADSMERAEKFCDIAGLHFAAFKIRSDRYPSRISAVGARVVE